MSANKIRFKHQSTVVLLAIFLTTSLFFQNCSGGFKGSGSDSQDLASSGGSDTSAGAPSVDGPGESPLRRISNLEYTNSLTDAITMQFSRQNRATLATPIFSSTQIRGLISTLPQDYVLQKLGSDQILSSLSSSRLEAYIEIADGVSGLITNSSTTLQGFVGTCAKLNTDLTNQTCVDAFIDRFGMILFRRPVSNEERNELKTKISTWRDLIGRMLVHPRFLMRLEREGTLNSTTGVYKLNAFELEARLAAVFWKSVPDLEGLNAAASGKLDSPEGLRAEIKRILASPKTRDTLWIFYRLWLGEERIPTGFDCSGTVAMAFAAELCVPNPALAGKFMSSVTRANIVADGKEFVEGITWTNLGKMDDLFRSRAIYTRNPAIASIYGVTPVTDASPAPRTDASGNYAGILTRLFFTTQKPSINGETNHILRGVLFATNMLGVELGDPASFEEQNALPPLTAGASTRAQVIHQTSPKACMGCHSIINPSGFAFAHFDSFGRYKVTETRYVEINGKAEVRATNPISAQTELNIRGKLYSINSVPSLVDAITESGVLYEAFARSYFRFVMGRIELSQQDDNLLASFAANLKNKSIVSSLEELAMHPDFARAKATK